MAVTALSGQRWQGSSTAEKTPDYSTTFGSSDITGWRTNQTHVFIDTGNNMLEFENDDDSTDEYLNYDLGSGNVSNDSWILRYELVFNTLNLSDNDVNNALIVGIMDNATPSGIVSSGDAITYNTQVTNTSIANVLSCVNGGSQSKEDVNNDPFSSSTATGTTFYVEIKRVSATSTEQRVYSTSDYSTTQVGTTLSRSTTSAVTALRYLTIQVQNGVFGGSGYTGYIKNLKFWNQTSTTQDDKTTVTDVPVGSQFEETNTRKFYQMGESNVSGTSLKAYYKMNGSSTTEIVNVASTVTGNSTLGTDANIDLINAPTPSVTGTPTNLGTSYTFNGTDELGKMGDSGDLSQWTFMHNQTASFTFNVWIKFPSGTQPVNNKYFWDNSRETDTVPSFQIRGKGGFWRVIVSQGASGGWVMSTDDNPQLDCPQDQEWHMYTFTYDYLNTPNFTYRVDANTSGTYYETKNNSSQNASNSDAPVQPYFFATQNTGGGTTGWQAGTACELAIWDRILTSAEITTLYASGDGLQLDTGLKVWTERGTAI